MQSLFIQPITYFINRLLYPFSMSYIRLSYDETTLVEFNGSKLKMNPCLSHLTDILLPSITNKITPHTSSSFPHSRLLPYSFLPHSRLTHEHHHQPAAQPRAPPPTATTSPPSFIVGNHFSFFCCFVFKFKC